MWWGKRRKKLEMKNFELTSKLHFVHKTLGELNKGHADITDIIEHCKWTHGNIILLQNCIKDIISESVVLEYLEKIPNFTNAPFLPPLVQERIRFLLMEQALYSGGPRPKPPGEENPE